MEKTPPRHLALTALVSLSLAGTCLAVPGLALAETGSLASIAENAAAATKAAATTDDVEEAEVESQTLAAGGVQVSVPGSYAVSNDAGYPLAMNEDETVAVAVIDMGLDADGLASIPEDRDEALAGFAEVALESVEDLDGNIADSDVVQVADGAAVAYCYGITCTADDGTDSYLAAYFVVTDKSLVLVQIVAATDALDDLNDELAAIEASLTLSGTDALEGTVYEVGGLAVTIPDDTFELDGEVADDSATWFSTDGNAMITVMGDLGGGETIDAAYFDALAEELIDELDGTAANATVLTNDDLEISLYGFTIENDGDTYYGAIGLANVSDDCLSAILVLFSDDADAELNDTLEAVLLAVAPA
jgi:hypothetical protein